MLCYFHFENLIWNWTRWVLFTWNILSFDTMRICFIYCKSTGPWPSGQSVDGKLHKNDFCIIILLLVETSVYQWNKINGAKNKCAYFHRNTKPPRGKRMKKVYHWKFHAMREFRSNANFEPNSNGTTTNVQYSFIIIDVFIN